MMKLFNNIFAFAEKELDLMTRFRMSFLLASFFEPISKIVPIVLIYYGFLHFAGVSQFGEITKETYIVFLSLGMFAFVLFNLGCSSFAHRFQEEKFWKTIDALFISPISILSYIAGVGLSEIIRAMPMLVAFIAIAFVVKPVSIVIIVLVVAIILLVYLLSLSFGLVWGSIFLSKEGAASVFVYIYMAWNFFSCFYYPITVFPTNFAGLLNIRLIAEINPIFQGLDFIRKAWISGEVNMLAFLYVAVFAIAMPFVAAHIFKKSWQNLGVEGY